MAPYFLERGEGTIGELAVLFTVAIASGEEGITAAMLDVADYLGVS